MELSKQIPTRRKTIRFLWCREFLLAGALNDARTRIGMKPFAACYWCRHEFERDEMTHLAAPEKGANRILCGNCAEEMKEDR